MSSNSEQMTPGQVITGATPSYTLFDSGAVALATLFGTPAAEVLSKPKENVS
ncbi:MAG: hypothetical protein ABI164_05735 [Acidobacteriaceae bacterium]